MSEEGTQNQGAGEGDNQGAGDGQGQTSWLDSLPEDFEFRQDPSLATIPDVPTLAKNYVETKKLVGKKGVILPGEKDPEEKWEEVYTALGRPETPDGYEFARPDLPEGLTYAEDFEKDFRAQAHKAGLSAKQAKALYDWYVPLTMEWAKVGEAALTKAKEELASEWGDKVEENTRLAAEAFKRFASPEDYQTMFEGPTPLGNDPRLVRFFYKVGLAMQEDKFVSGKAGGGAEDLDQQIAEVEKNPALYDAKDPQHDALVKKRDELYRKKYPETA